MLPVCPLTTKDLDIVHRRSPENIQNLMRVLVDVDSLLARPRKAEAATERVTSLDVGS